MSVAMLPDDIPPTFELRQLDHAAHTQALADLFEAVQLQLSEAEASELSHLGLDDHRLFAAGVLAAYSDRRLQLTRETRRAALRLLNQ